MLEVFLDALIDSLKVLAVIFVFNFIFTFFEKRIAKKINNKSKLNPLLGALFGLVPECGFSVVASDLYLKNHITMGTLVAVFIACSDEALPIFLSNPSKIIMILPLLAIKFVIGFIVGFLVDVFLTKDKKNIEEHHEHCEHEESVHIGCCHHNIEEEENESKFHEYVLHPLIHSLKLFAYVLVINIVFGMVVYFVKEDNIATFLKQSEYLTPLFSTLVGLIPNCASSVIISKLYLANQINFGSCIAGLICNAGLGFVFLFKDKKSIKNTMKILLIVMLTALIVGYAINLIFGFGV